MDPSRTQLLNPKKIATTHTSHAGTPGVLSFGPGRVFSAWYVYVDWTCESSPRPFYVGMGNHLRVRNLHRNAKHSNIVQKHGQRRDVVFAASNYRMCLDHEIELIAELGTFAHQDSIGCNFTKGGDGTIGVQRSLSWRHKQSIARLGKQLSLETKQRMSAAHSTPAAREELRKRMLGSKRTPETLMRLSESLKGKNTAAKSQEHREKISAALTGKSFTEEHKQNMRAAVSVALKKLYAERRLRVLEEDIQ